MPALIRVLLLPALLVLALSAAAFAQTAPEHPPMHMSGVLPVEGGQAAFAAIQEIVTLLEANKKTDWSKVDLEALRQHLIDMNNVTLAAAVKSESVAGGMRFTVTGEGPVRDSIRRMVLAHAAIMEGAGDWHFLAAATGEGAVLTVSVPAKDATKLHGLGFIGVMARGMHHQEHHLMALAEAKALRVASRFPGYLVIGADQMLVRGKNWLDKPRDKDDARQQLRSLRGESHELVTAVCVVKNGSVIWRLLERPKLTMRRFDDAFIETYLAAIGPEDMGAVGAYRIEGLGIQLFAKVEGDFFSILGLPLLPLLDFLRGHGEVP